MSSMVSKQHLAKANALRLLMASYARSEDLIRIGAYQKNSDPILDSAVENLPALNAFLQQPPAALEAYPEIVTKLMALTS
jgi:flagellum-specific ATP synthase